MSFNRLIEAIKAKKNPTVVGLDPKPDYVPSAIREKAYKQYGETLEGISAAVLEFNVGLIDALYDIVPAIKPQCAYYEALGWQGMRVLYETIAYAKKKGLFVIADGKRNDIGSTMEAYSDAFLGKTKVGANILEPFGADALTVNGYLGTDGVKPLLNACREFDKGIFILVKTSNPSSGELQDKILGDAPLYRAVGALCEKWGADDIGGYGYSPIGAVVGATYPQQLAELRSELKHTFFLVPGYGAQGGGAADVAGAFDENGLGAVVNSSRGIICAYKKEGCDESDYAGAARREAIRMRDDIGRAICEK